MVMRLQQLRLAPYGCFADQELVFGPKGCVDLVLGPNAAGKSTLVRGTLGLVFGIEQRTVDAHTFPYSDLRIGGRIELGDGTVDVVRRKGRAGTLATPGGDPLPDDLFRPGLGGLNKDVFASLFVIDNPSLKRGATELLQGRGEVGASLFAAAAGIATLHSTVERFETEAKRAFNPGGRKDPVHNALRDLRAAQKRQREATLRPRKHRDMERELQALEAECEALRGEIAGLEAEARGLRRMRAVAPLLARHQEVSEALEKLVAIPDLPADARSRRTAAEASKRSAGRRLSRAREKADELAGKLGALEVDEALLQRAGELRAVHQGVPVITKAAADRPRREQSLAAAKERLRLAAATAGVDDPARVERLRRPESDRRRLDDAIRAHGQLAERRRAAASALASARERVREAQDSPSESREPVDTTAVTAAFRAALEVRPLAEHARDAAAEAERLNSVVHAELAQLSPGRAGLDELRGAAVPTVEAVAAAAAAADELRQAERDLEADRQRLAREREELQEGRDQLELGAAVPTATDLSRSRGDRDETWTEVRSVLEHGLPAKPGLASEYERRVGEADSVADAQAAGAASLAAAARIEATERKLLRRAQAHAERERELSGRRARLADEWNELWAPCGLVPPAVDAAKGWLERRERILALVADASRHEAKARAAVEAVERHAGALMERLATHGVEPAPSAGLAEVLKLAEQVLERADTQRRGHEERVRELTEATAALDRAERDAAAADAAWESWEESWPAVLESAGLPAATSPESALEVARAVADGLEQLAAMSELERSIAGIDRDRRHFEAQVSTLCEGVAPDLSELEPEAAVAALMQRLARAEADAAAQASLRQQQADLAGELEEAEREHSQAEDALEELLQAAGCQEIAEMPRLEAESSRARALREELAQLERDAAEVGETRFDQLMTDLAGFDPDEAAARLGEIEAQAEKLSESRDQVKTSLGERRAELRGAELDTGPVEAAEDAALAEAELARAAAEHLRAKVAAIVVRRAMERYRRLHQDPLLVRANGLFARFTLGSFVELFVDHDEDVGAILMGRQRDRQLKRVEEMSSGTREQLFLALRLAAIERYVKTTSAVPVILDDAVLESDETRAVKVFEALGELAAQTQVIVLTHRETLARLGQQVLGNRVSVVELPDAAPVLRAAEAEPAAA